jgi:hypothetical protein
MANRAHLLLTVVLAGALLTLGLLAAFGAIEIRWVDKVDKPAPGARIAPAEGADEFFKTLGDEAYCFKYEGAWIDCWIEEVDQDGVKTRPWEASGKVLREMQGGQGQAAGTPSGYLVWVRRKRNDHEEWSLGVSAVGKGGQSFSSLKASGISSPPLPKGGSSGSHTLPSGGSLANAKEITLMAFTVGTSGANKGKVEWSASLMCKAAE